MSLVSVVFGAVFALATTLLVQARADRRETLRAHLEKDIRFIEPRREVYREFHRAVMSIARLRRGVLLDSSPGGVGEYLRIGEKTPELYVTLHRTFAEILLIASPEVQRSAHYSWEGVASIEHDYFDDEHTSDWPGAVEWSEKNLTEFLAHARRELGIAKGSDATPVIATFDSDRGPDNYWFDISAPFREFQRALGPTGNEKKTLTVATLAKEYGDLWPELPSEYRHWTLGSIEEEFGLLCPECGAFVESEEEQVDHLHLICVGRARHRLERYTDRLRGSLLRLRSRRPRSNLTDILSNVADIRVDIDPT